MTATGNVSATGCVCRTFADRMESGAAIVMSNAWGCASAVDHCVCRRRVRVSDEASGIVIAFVRGRRVSVMFLIALASGHVSATAHTRASDLTWT